MGFALLGLSGMFDYCFWNGILIMDYGFSPIFLNISYDKISGNEYYLYMELWFGSFLY